MSYYYTRSLLQMRLASWVQARKLHWLIPHRFPRLMHNVQQSLFVIPFHPSLRMKALNPDQIWIRNENPTLLSSARYVELFAT